MGATLPRLPVSKVFPGISQTGPDGNDKRANHLMINESDDMKATALQYRDCGQTVRAFEDRSASAASFTSA